MAVERDITWNIRHFQGALRCDRNFDVVYRVFRICGREACMFFVDGFAKDEIMEKLLEFFYGIQDEDLLRDAHTFSKSCVPYCEVAISGEEDTIVGQILSGVWAVFVDGMDQCVLIDQRTYPQRTTSEPDQDKSFRGSRDGFVETMVFNAALIRRRIRDKNGQMRGMEYTVLEQPQPPEQGPEEATPKCAQPKQAKPKREKPVQANPAQLNTKEQKKEITKNVSNPIRTADEREQYRDLIRENIEYDILAKNNPADRIRLDELVELMLDTVCSKRSSIRIAGDEFPTEVVKSRFLKLEAQHIQYVLDSLKDNPPHIRNIKKYLLAALYNAPLTIENYYAAQINHDLYGRNRGDVNWK